MGKDDDDDVDVEDDEDAMVTEMTVLVYVLWHAIPTGVATIDIAIVLVCISSMQRIIHP